MWVKKNSTDWVDVKKVWVKKSPTSWVAAKKIWVKNASSIWSQFWPEAGPYPDEEPYVFTSSTTYPSIGTSYPELTAYVYHFYFDGSLTLKYKWSVSTTTSGPWTDLPGYETYQTYSPGNPSIGSFNSVSITPDIDNYEYVRSYFKFSIQATDASGISTREAISEPIYLGSPYWYQTPSFSGTASPTFTFMWDAGIAHFQESSSNIGYMTTIYKSDNNGVTRDYLVGSETTPEYSYNDNTEYSFTPLEVDIGYTYYASTYAIHGDLFGPFQDALPSTTISSTKKVVGPPGPFSITSFVKGKITGDLVNGSRRLYINYTPSADATDYEYKVERSIDNVTWYSWSDYFGQTTATDPTTELDFSDPNVYSYRYYRATMRATNSTGLYTTSTNTNVLAVGTAPGAPTLDSVTTSFGNLTLNYTETTNVGSGTGIYAHDYAYKLSTDTTYSNWIYTESYGGSLGISGLTPGLSYDFKLRSYNDDNLFGPSSNVKSGKIPLEPGPLTSIDTKTFNSGQLTVGFTTGANTTGVYYFAFNGPYVGGQQFVKENFGVFSNLLPNTSYVRTITDFQTTDDPYDVILYAQNEDVYGDNVGPSIQVATGKYPDGSDKPTSSIPTLSNVSATGFTANFSLSGSINKAVVDLKKDGSSVSGYPKTISVTSATTSYAIPETLTRSTAYTFYITPRYTNTSYSAFTYDGTQRSVLAATLYKFDMSDTLYVGTNGYIGLTSGSSGYSAAPASGYNILVHLADFVQYQNVGDNGSGLLYKWSNSTQYSLRWSGYLIGYPNNANYRVTYQINFYTDQNYYDIKYIHVGSSVYSTDAANAAPGLYINGTLKSAGTTLPFPWLISSGTTYRVYYNGSSPTASVAFSEIAQGKMVDVGAVTNGSSDDGYTAIVTSTGQGVQDPVAPTALSATTNSSSATTLTWSGGTASYYEFFYGSQNTTFPSEFADFGTDGSITTSPYAHDAPRGYDYYYFVRSVAGTTTSNSKSGWYPAAAPGIKGHRLLYAPPTPNTPTSSGITATNITVSWTAGTNGATNDTATSYEVFTNTTGTAPATTTSGTVKTSPTSYSYTASSSPTTQYFWVRGVTEGGNSAWSGRLSATPTAQYTITYDGNGSTGGSTSDTTGNGTVTLRANGFTKTGYTFSKWNTNAAGTGTDYNASTSYTLSSSVTLYAKWTENATAPTAPTLPTTPLSAAYNTPTLTVTLTRNSSSQKTQTWSGARTKTYSLSWNSVSNATSYDLYYNSTGTAPQDTFSGDFNQTGTTKSWTTSTAATWHWWVRAKNDTGKSAWVKLGSNTTADPAMSNLAIRLYNDQGTYSNPSSPPGTTVLSGTYVWTSVNTSRTHYGWARGTVGGEALTARSPGLV